MYEEIFLLPKGVIYINRFFDITNIYEIISIGNGYFEIIIGNKKFYVYPFKIKPVILLSKNDKYIFELLNKYEEFLRNIDLNFQILITSREMQSRDFFSLKKENFSYEKAKFMEEYSKNLDEMLNGKDILSYDYYIIITSIYIIKDEEKYIRPLEEAGIDVEKISKKEEIEKIIMEGVMFYE